MKNIIVILSLLLVTACGQKTAPVGQDIAQGTTLFSVVSQPNYYQINGINNATLNLQRGMTYTINVVAVGHPFYIMTEPSTDPHMAYPYGVINNGVEDGTLYFNVPNNAPSKLYYNSSADPGLTGTINIGN